MSRVLFCFLIFLLLGCSQSGFSIEKLEDKNVKSLIAKLHFEREMKFKNYNFRAFSMTDDGECDGDPSTCPKSIYYLVISTIDLYPDREVFVLPSSFGWKLVEVVEVDSLGEYQKHLVVTLMRTLPSDDPSEGWWKEEIYKVKISPWRYQVISGD